MTKILSMNRLPPPGYCGTDVIIPDTGGITGTGTIIMYAGTDVIIRRIIFTMPEDGTKADTITMLRAADTTAAAAVMTAAHAAADAAAAEVMIVAEAEADAAAAESAEAVEADAISSQ